MMRKPFVKWAGCKRTSMSTILEHLPQGNRLVEPFLGSGAVTLATDFDRYLLGDLNADLISAYKELIATPEGFMKSVADQFDALDPKDAEGYYKLRDKFNAETNSYQRAVLFIVMNRYGYNGMCRYNLSGGFNVPHGRYDKVYFPMKEFEEAAIHLHRTADIRCASFTELLDEVVEGDVVYADPPYIPLSRTSDFTEYTATKFTVSHHVELASRAEAFRLKGIPMLISNADVELAHEVYANATQVIEMDVRRTISASVASRKKVKELLFIY